MALLPLGKSILPVVLLEGGQSVHAVHTKVDHNGIGISLGEITKAVEHFHHGLPIWGLWLVKLAGPRIVRIFWLITISLLHIVPEALAALPQQAPIRAFYPGGRIDTVIPPNRTLKALALPIPVIPLELPSYQKKENWGASETLYHLTRTLIGFPRHLSQHTGGVVIAKEALCRMVPIENAAMPERSVIQWDKDDLDALGLLKVDVLALGMLTALRKAMDFIGQWHGQPFDLPSIPREDPACYEMMCRADTIGVFQIESRAQMSMLPRLKPRAFYDLVVEVALVRPGPIQGGMVHPYLRRRQGLEPIDYPRGLQAALKRTLGVPIFQEQVMQIAMIAAGFTAGEADDLRRSMAAWRRKGDVHKFKERIKAGMRANQYSPEFAEQIAQVQMVLKEIGAADIPQLLVFNKVDAIALEAQPIRIDDFYEIEGVQTPRLFVSARTLEGMPLLRQKLAEIAKPEPELTQNSAIHPEPLGDET